MPGNAKTALPSTGGHTASAGEQALTAEQSGSTGAAEQARLGTLPGLSFGIQKVGLDRMGLKINCS